VLTRAINQAIESGLCPAGYEPADTEGDGSPDVCLQVVASKLDAQPEGFCPAGFPYGSDSTGDGNVDICYANPAPLDNE